MTNIYSITMDAGSGPGSQALLLASSPSGSDSVALDLPDIWQGTFVYDQSGVAKAMTFEYVGGSITDFPIDEMPLTDSLLIILIVFIWTVILYKFIRGCLNWLKQ